MEELFVPPDLPIEMIAEEVKESWRLKEVHVEKLMQKVSSLGYSSFASVLCQKFMCFVVCSLQDGCNSKCAQLA